jgi:cystathionine gamma-synthase
MTHAGMDEAARLRAGIGPGLLRMSVGIEAAADLVADLNAGLERAGVAAATPIAKLSRR